jgi:polar amino acid transport system substrate-binding protein
MKWVAAIVLLLCVFVVAPPPQSQGQQESLRVATRVLRPFVIQEGDNLTGFSMDLWQEIAVQLGVRSEYVIKPTVADLLTATRDGAEADVAISAISITEERERQWDFSLPMFEAGLQILVPADADGGGGFGRILGSLLNPAFLPMIAFVILGAIVAGHIVWLFERRKPGGLLDSPAYFPGIFESTFWAVSTLATQADSMPRTAVARVVAVFWMFTAVLFIAFFTASVTSSLTVQSLKSDINGPDDLPGKRVATLRGSTSANYLKGRNIDTNDFTTIDEAIQALMKGDADAVVYDAPVLQYFASHEGKGKVQVVGGVFRKESYGILFPAGSPHRKPVNEALLRLRENGTYERLQTKYFGDESERKGS